jgi:hypothetical protein
VFIPKMEMVGSVFAIKKIGNNAVEITREYDELAIQTLLYYFFLDLSDSFGKITKKLFIF